MTENKDFKPYQSINKMSNEKFIAYCRQHGYIDDVKLFYNSEKIDGRNWSVLAYPDDRPTQHALKEILVKEEENHDDFRNWESTKHLEAQCKAIAVRLGKPIQVYYEQYGYKIGGTQYKPTIEGIDPKDQRDYVVLKIRLIDEYSYIAQNEDEWSCPKYLQLDEKLALCKEFGLTPAPILKIGTFDECIKESADFESVLAKSFGHTVKAEGFVTAPVVAMFDPKTEATHIIIKTVAEAYSDVKKSSQLSTGNAGDMSVEDYHAMLIGERANIERVEKRARDIAIAPGAGNTLINRVKIARVVVADIVKEVKELDKRVTLKEDQIKEACMPHIEKYLTPEVEQP